MATVHQEEEEEEDYIYMYMLHTAVQTCRQQTLTDTMELPSLNHFKHILNVLSLKHETDDTDYQNNKIK